jgi:mannose-6-phosphate isomerase-like protein (cupin superfamily)
MKIFDFRTSFIFGFILLMNISTLIAQDAVTTNPDLFRVLLDNERVRVLDQRMAPGRKENMHSHPAYVKYTLSSYRGTVSYLNGNTTSMRRINPGQVMWFDGETHAQRNSGRTEMHTIMFELKGAQILQSDKQQITDDPVDVAGKTHKQLMENDRVRVLEFRLKPKEETPLHHHRDGVFYILNGGTMTETLSDGSSHEVTLNDRDVKWMDAKSHKVKNTGTTEVRMIIVELKD